MLLDSIETVFAAVYAMKTAERDTIFSGYCIQNFGGDFKTSAYFASTLYVRIDTSVSWTNQLWNGKPTSGNTTIDSLLDKYAFSVRVSNFTSANIIYFEVDNPLHLRPLERVIAREAGVTGTQSLGTDGGVPFYDYEVSGDTTQLTFSYGWGDCPAGCTGRREWTFEITGVCEARLVNAETVFTTPQPMPSTTNCSTSRIDTWRSRGSTDYGVSVIPNPVDASAELSVRVAHTDSEGLTLRLYDATGRVLREAEVRSRVTSLNLRNRSVGVYYVTVTGKAGVDVKPFLVR